MKNYYPNPFIRNIFIDSCSFDPKYSPEDKASVELFKMHDSEKINLIISHSNQKEIEHPNTPAWVKERANELIFTCDTPLTPDEINKKKEILKILTGNGKAQNMQQDSLHVFEALKYGTYFVTTDQRILKRQEQLHRGFGLHVVKPSKLFKIMQEEENYER